uniref:Uncharacterized protein n=1 Tax=Schistocephalus solidus TaxID=70667 RepID=A0A0X3Q2A5_SCHSO
MIQNFLLLMWLFHTATCEEHMNSLSFNVEHSFDGGQTFSKKGTLIISPAKRDTASITDEPALTAKDLRALKELVERDSLYIVRLLDKESVAQLMSSCRAVPFCFSYVSSVSLVLIGRQALSNSQP